MNAAPVLLGQLKDAEKLLAQRARGEEPDTAFFAQYDQFNL